MKRSLLAMSAAVALLAGPASTAAPADSTLLRFQFAPRALALADGRIVWSQYETKNEVTRVRLYTWKRGRTKRLPVFLDEVGWEIDLGRDARGRQVLTYSLCNVGCRLYEYVFSTGRKHLLRRSARGIDRAPTRWGRYVAWTRTPDALAYPRIYIKRLPNGRARRLPGGPLPRCRLEKGANICDTYGGYVREIDLRQRRVAYIWPESRPSGGRVSVRVVDAGGRTRVLGSSRSRPGVPMYFSLASGAGRVLAGFRAHSGESPRSSLVSYEGGRARWGRAPRGLLHVGPFGRSTAYFFAHNWASWNEHDDICPCAVRLRRRR